MEIPSAENPRFPGAGSSARGQSVPKARPKGVADGQRVNIPVPAHRVQRQILQDAAGRGLSDGRPSRKASATERGSPIRRPGDQHCREKIWRTEASTVPKPTQVGWYKHTKARERNLVKELGTMAP